MIVKADYVFQPTTTRQDNTFVVGATWKSGYTVPPREGSRCKGDTTNEFQSTVKEVKPMPVMLDGKETVVEVAVVAQEGTWNVPDCGSGRGSALIVYAIDKKVIISIESLAYYGTGIVSGSRLQPVDIIQRKTP
jgi:hypothetical protein